MEAVFSVAATNLTSPVVLFFILGILISLMKAKVELPSSITDFIGVYLLIAIGFKGGVEIAQAEFSAIFLTIIGATAVGLIIPVYSFFVLWRIGKQKTDDAAAIAGHYGSISVVTFVAATAFLDGLNIPYEGFINGLPAIMEAPAIVVALLLAVWAKRTGRNGDNNQNGIDIKKVTRKVLLSKGVFLLLGAMVVGYLTGPNGMTTVKFFYKDLFMGMLSIFMLDMGIVAGSRLYEFRKAGLFLVGFGILMPLVNGLLGILTGYLVGLSIGGTTLLGVLAASSSYIVAPAAMRVSLPKANPALYLGASLGITLPFNLILGIPIYYYATVYFSGFLQ